MISHLSAVSRAAVSTRSSGLHPLAASHGLRGIGWGTAGTGGRQDGIGTTHRDQQIRCQATSARHDSWPPRSIWAVGKNYVEHIRELKSVLNIDQDIPQEPIIFLKAGACCLPGGSEQPSALPLPTWSENVHYEVELAVQLGADLQPVRAAVSIDLTARDVQSNLKAKGYPWALAKSFPAACPIGPFFDIGDTDLHALTLGLEVNGEVRQKASTGGMIFKVPSLLSYLKERFPLQPGDLVLTGTPEGVGRVVPGDVLTAWLTGNGGHVLSKATWQCTGHRKM